MKVAITADGHCDERSRFDEWQRVHAWMADDWRDRGVSLALNGGDLYERRSTPDERNAMAAHVRRGGEFAEQIVVRGNHDITHDLLLLQELDTKHPIRVLEHPEVVTVGDVAVVCLPWPRTAAVLQRAADLGLDSEGAEQLAGDALRQILASMGQGLDLHQGAKIMLAHAMVRGSRTSTGQPLVGCDMEVGLEDLRLAGCDLYALGHIHLPQSWPESKGDVFYTGSPRRTAFGELEEKSYVLWDTDTGQWERIATPCAPMLQLEAIWTDGDFVGSHDTIVASVGGVQGAELRFRYTVPAEHREAAAYCANTLRTDWTALGAKSVQLEPQTVTLSVAKAPEVAEAIGTAAKLRAMWRLRGNEPDDPDSVLEKLATLEAGIE